MLNADEIIESGFAALKGEQPTRTSAELAVRARRREARTKLNRTVAGAAGCTVIATVLAIAFRPESALAILADSMRQSASQPIVHAHFEGTDYPANPTSPPWPQRPALDIWKYSDRYLRKEGHWLSELYRDGRIYSYDDRFSDGNQGKYDAGKDRFWEFDGTIGLELNGMHRYPPTVHNVTRQGREFIRYNWKDVDGMHNSTDESVYVDAQSKLIRYGEQHRTSEQGDVNEGTSTIDYPSAEVAAREQPKFPPSLKFRTDEEILAQFHRALATPDQSKNLGGIRTTLYAVLVHPNTPDGLGVDVITTGGAGPDYGSGHQPEVSGSARLGRKRSDWWPLNTDPKQARNGWVQPIGGRKYIINQSDDLLLRAPTRLTIRVPVWRLSSSTMEREGKLVHAHEFVGYVTFTTSKIVADSAGSELNMYGIGRIPQ